MPWRWPRRRPGAPVVVLAHRGGAGPFRENTLEAFAAALAAGADGVELDVRQCADGALVVHHDPDVPGSGPIHECARHDLPAWVPTLDGALETLAGSMVNVEIKNVPTEAGYDPAQHIATDVATVLAGAALTRRSTPGEVPAHVVVSSFWPDTIAAVGHADRVAARPVDRDWSAGGAVPLGLLVHPAFDAPSALDAAAGLLCAALHPHHSQVTTELVRHAHGLGVAVVSWTVNDPDDLDAVVDAGVDGVITDRVTETLAHLGRSAPT
jgi:glycerophosphoryl diester phosphodiesterase